MTLGEALELLRYQAAGDIGDNSPWRAQDLKLALDWALDELAGRAAKASKSRMLYEFRLDAENGVSKYTLPESIRTVKSVWHDGFTPRRGYTKIQHHAQALAEEPTLRAPSNYANPFVYWLTHRTLHLKPEPTADEPAKIIVYAFGRPPLPRREQEIVQVPPEAERWWIAYAATMLLPPPDAGAVQALQLQLGLADKTLRDWLWRDSADVSPAPMPTGALIS